MAYLVHQISFLTPRFGLAGAASAVALTTITGVLGRVALGWVGDRYPKRWLAISSCLLQAAGVIVAAHTDAPLALYLSAALVGLTIGTVVALHPLLMADTFGVRSYGTVYGPGYLLTQLGQAAGPLAGGRPGRSDGRLPPAVQADGLGGYRGGRPAGHRDEASPASLTRVLAARQRRRAAL